MNIGYSLLLLLYLTHNTSAWFFNSPVVDPIRCDTITTPLITHYENVGYGNSMDYKSLLHHINNKNVSCATIYSNTNELFIVDTANRENPNMINLHRMNTLPQLTDNIINLFQKRNIQFDITAVRPWSTYDINFFMRMLIWFQYAITLFMVMRTIRRIYTIYRFRSLVRSYIKHNVINTANTESKSSTKKSNTTFADVAGCDEAKYELTEIVDFLKQPSRYKNAGAKVPAGVLLEGPPGTGKTLLAKATAGEADVSFLSATGSEFVEMYVGVGASRIRTLFEEANEIKPCIIFIDEIDAIGQQRADHGGNSERDQTLNQLLTNMDGFDESDGIIVMAATNRADILDRALLRPGRFDRKITVGVPDKDGRKQILNVHLKNKKVDVDVDFDMIYELTSGFTGAELANLANESAILSVRYNTSTITDKCFMDAFEKITIGLPKAKENRDKESIKLVAYHEGGHALIAMFFQDIFDVRRVTINANNAGAGGYTLFTPKEQYASLPSKRYMLANIIVALGGRAAEIILYRGQTMKELDTYEDDVIFDGEADLDVTAGASNDLKQANDLARRYVSLFGLGKDVGLYDIDAASPSYGAQKTSEHTKSKIDKEVKMLVNYALKRALDIIGENKSNLERLHELLIAHKTITTEHLKENIKMVSDIVPGKLYDTE